MSTEAVTADLALTGNLNHPQQSSLASTCFLLYVYTAI